MAAPDAPSDDWAVQIATALHEFWALVAENGDGLVDAWRLMSVCTASREGVKKFLSTLPGLVVCGGCSSGEVLVRDVWRLNLATLRWEPMPDLLSVRNGHMCCAVRGTIVVLGGETSEDASIYTSSVEMLSEEQGAFVSLPSLSCGEISHAAAVAVDESDSAAGQVLLLGGDMVSHQRWCTW